MIIRLALKKKKTNPRKDVEQLHLSYFTGKNAKWHIQPKRNEVIATQKSVSNFFIA